MEPIVSKLNEAAFKNLKVTGGSSGGMGEVSGFQRTFEQTMSDRLMERLSNHIQAQNSTDITVLSADNIHIKTKGAEMGDRVSSGTQYMDLLKEMNRDLLSLDATIETLSTPGIKLSPRQLLALQAGVANTTLLAEGFSRFTETIGRGIQNVVQMQV